MTDDAVTYQCRTDALHREVTWRLHSGNVLEAVEDGVSRHWWISDLRAINIRGAAGRMSDSRTLCTLTFPSEHVVISNSHYAGFAQFEDRSEGFSALIRALDAAVGQYAPHVVATVGSSRASYLGSLAVGWGGMLLLATVLIAWHPYVTAWNVIRTVLVVGLYGAGMWTYTKANRPRTYVAGTLPPDALPRPAGTA
jgi:hypothetical protein